MKKASASTHVTGQGKELPSIVGDSGGICRAYSLIVAAAVAAALLTACNEKDQQDSNGSLVSLSGNQSLSVSAQRIRPQLDPKVMEEVRQEEETEARRKVAAAEAAAQEAARQQKQQQAQDPSQRDLPPVDTSPISGIANALGFGNNNNQNAGNNNNGAPTQMPAGVPISPPTYTYGGGYGGNQPSGTSLIPPPPAISVTATNVTAPAEYGQYGYPPPYGGGYPPPQYYAPQQQQQPPQPSHPAGSPFSSGNSGAASNASNDEEEARKKQNVVLITPTGMDSRSSFKQRDDLRILIKSAFANAKDLRDDKLQQLLAKTEVGLPSDSTKGNINLTQRQIDNLFKTPPVDKKFFPAVKRIETDLAQAYYRYLYVYNKYSLTEQQIAARKQEVDVADSNSEKQRAAADLSSVENAAEDSKEELHSAQLELASMAGPQAARSIITKVTRVAPSLDSLAVGDSDSGPQSKKREEGLLSALNPMNVFGAFHHGKDSAAVTTGGGKEKSSGSSAVAEKVNKKGSKGGKGGGSPAPAAIATSDSETSEPDSSPPEKTTPAPTTTSGVSFELKNVQTLPRKSVLKVAIRNNGSSDINIDSEAISVAEGDHKLADAAVNTEFEASTISPNQEVTGTITIFGRPWNDKLSVSLSEGGKFIQLRR